MSTFEELQKEFQQKVEALRQKCEHPKSFWAEQWWAIAHSTGNAVRVCSICRKTLETIPLSEAYEKGFLKRRVSHVEFKVRK